MTITTKFQVRDNSGVISTDDSLRDAILNAARSDMYGARFERMNDEGDIHPSFPMRFFSSGRHIGNNAYSINPTKDAYIFESNLADDDAAENEVAAQVFKRGYYGRDDITIVELTYDDSLLTHVDGRTVEDLLDDEDDEDATIELIRAIYK
jgi:hypothetical protein